jgi:hypothetical protein
MHHTLHKNLRCAAAPAKVRHLAVIAQAPSLRALSAFLTPFIHQQGEQHAKEHDLPVGWVSGGGAYSVSLSRLF